MYINGAPQGITFHETDNFTLYPASILSVNKNRFTKHYFIGDKRIASRIGTGLFNNVYGRNGSYVTAGQQDYAERMNQIQTQKEAYYKKVGVAPGVPTMKGAYDDPKNTHIGYNSIIRELGNHDVPQGWIQTPRPNTTPNTNPGPPVSWNDPSTPDDPQAGYGYIPNDTTKEETFFYHSDHLGSTSYITDDHANITQYDAYLPYGELLVDEHSSSEDLPYKFNGKQFDEETGLYYYGARYLNPMASIWYGVDPLTEKYMSTSGYIYVLNNPIRLLDPNGKDIASAIAETVGTFVISAGASFVEALISNGGNIRMAMRQIDWEGASVDAVVAGATSLIFSGASTTKLIKKLAETKIGRSNLAKIMTSTVTNMINNISASVIKGEKTLNDIDLKQELFVALSGSLSDAGLGKLSEKLEKSLKDAKKVLRKSASEYHSAVRSRRSTFYQNYIKTNMKKNQVKTRQLQRKFFGANVLRSVGSNLVQEGTRRSIKRK